MARTLFWEPARVGEQVTGTGDTNEVLRILTESFGRDPEHPLSPVELSNQHVFMLRDLGRNAGPNSMFSQLADRIGQYGKIRVWARG